MPDRRRLIVIGPIPPPTHGVAVSTALVLANRTLRERFDVEHLDTTDRRPLSTVGAWDAANVTLGLRNLRELRRRLGGRPGLVYLPLSQSSGGFMRDALFVRAASLRGWRVAAHLRGGEFDTFYRALPGPLRALAGRTLLRIDSMAVVGERLRGLFRDLLPPERVAVVPNGSPDDFADASLESRERVVLYLSNLRERKGLLPALEAARLVLERDTSVRFVFAGDWRSPDLRARAEAIAAGAPEIRFETDLSPERKRGLLASSAVFLFPPVEPEGHPRVVLEALSAGLPVVTTDRGAIAETVEDGRSGFVLAEPDPGALAARMLDLLGDEERRVAMAREARRRFQERFRQQDADVAFAAWLDGVVGLT